MPARMTAHVSARMSTHMLAHMSRHMARRLGAREQPIDLSDSDDDTTAAPSHRVSSVGASSVDLSGACFEGHTRLLRRCIE